MKDDKNAGDRTLSAFHLKNELQFASYDYGDLDSNDDDQNNVNKKFALGANEGEWIFLYFGYSLKTRKAFAYTLYTKREDSNLFSGLKHFVPNKLWFYLGADGLNKQFEGAMFDWNLYFGDGAFTQKPRTLVKQMPYDDQGEVERVMSAILGNQGLSSVKLTRNGPVSGRIETSAGPLSGGMETTSGAMSG